MIKKKKKTLGGTVTNMFAQRTHNKEIICKSNADKCLKKVIITAQ